MLAILAAAAIIIAFFLGKNSHGQSDEDAILKDTISSVKVDSVNTNQDKTTDVSETQEKSSRGSKDKPTVQEQIKQQAKESNDTVARPSGLTKIDRGDGSKKHGSTGSGRLTPIEDKFKKDKSKNPITPTTPQKDNPTENPLNNQ